MTTNCASAPVTGLTSMMTLLVDKNEVSNLPTKPTVMNQRIKMLAR